MIYVDTNVFVYAIENHPKYGKSCKRILEGIEDGKIKTSASVLVLIELINVLNRMNKELKLAKSGEQLDIGMNITAIESLPITWLDLSFPIIERAAQYNYPINPIDYVHLAAMELNQISEIVSADGGLDKVRWATRIDPLEYR